MGKGIATAKTIMLIEFDLKKNGKYTLETSNPHILSLLKKNRPLEGRFFKLQLLPSFDSIELIVECSSPSVPIFFLTLAGEKIPDFLILVKMLETTRDYHKVHTPHFIAVKAPDFIRITSSAGDYTLVLTDTQFNALYVLCRTFTRTEYVREVMQTFSIMVPELH